MPQPEIPLNLARENIDKSDQIGLSGNSDQTAKSGEKAFPPGTESQASNQKLGRNDPCWCGSGKKWKHCHYPQLG
jgi:uncharacterized protein YecA (UPF0149 family)